MTSIAIMQPTYLPWIGYLAMIDRADRFVFLDSVQFEHRSWQQRNKIKTANGPIWLSLPVQIKGNREARINEVSLAEAEKSISKHLASLKQNYQRALYYNDYAPAFTDKILSLANSTIGDMNIGLITWFCEVLGVTTLLTRSSNLPVDGRKADLLADICDHYGAKIYISAPGSKEYIDQSSAFNDKGIQVIYHEYSHPVYEQLYGPFTPYMCTLDLLFNCGPQSLSILRSGVIKQ